MERRVDLFCQAFEKAARACELRFSGDEFVVQCADQIVKAAKGARLDPQLYQLMWLVLKTATVTRPINLLD